jgi:hypothetical protein
VLTSLLEVVPAYLDALGNLGVAYLHRYLFERCLLEGHYMSGSAV